MAHEEYRFADVVKDPAEAVIKFLDWFNLCANFWRPNEQYTTNEFVRPPKATGYSYQATTGGTSSATQPKWPITGTVADGSVIWTTNAASTNGLAAISAPSASAPTGITAGSLAVVETTKLQVTYSGGTDGQDYDVAFTVTVNGQTRIGRQRVLVRTR